MVDQARTNAPQIQPQGGIRKLLHIRRYRLIFFVSDHPGIGEEDVRFVISLQRRAQHVVIIIQLHIAELHVRIYLVESVKFRLQRLEVIVASGTRDSAG